MATTNLESTGVTDIVTAPFDSVPGHYQGAIRERNQAPPTRYLGLSMVTAKASFKKGNCPPLARHSVAFLLVTKIQFGRLGCHDELAIRDHSSQLPSVIRERPWQTPLRNSGMFLQPRRHSEAPLAIASALCGSIAGHCETKFGRVSSHRRIAIRQNSWSPPARNFGASLATGNASFGSSSVHSPVAIPDDDLQPQQHNSVTSLATMYASFG